MAEGIRFTNEIGSETTSDADDEKKSKKKKKSSAKLGSSAAAVVERSTEARETPTERPKPTAWEKLLVDLGLEKAPKSKEKSKAETALAEFVDVAPSVKTNHSEEAEKAAVEKLEPVRELTPDELNGGEVVIDLHGEEASADDGELTVANEIETEALQANAEAPEDAEQVDDPIQTTQTGYTTPSTATPRGATTAAGVGGSGSGRGANNPPPPPRPTPSPPPPPRPRATPQPLAPMPSPVTYNYNYAPPQQTSANTLSKVLARQQAVEQAAYYARRRGRGEGLIGGIIIGGLVEHFRHKSRERKMEKRAKQESQKQNKRFEELESQHYRLKTDQLEAARKAQAEQYQRKAETKVQIETTARLQMSEAEAIKRSQELKHTVESQEKEKAELIERLNAQAAEQEKIESEQLLKNSENRIETSAWHAIEVDKQGHAVQDTDIAYGHEYYKERAREVAPTDVTTRDSVTGAAAIAAVTMQRSTNSSQSSQSSSSAQSSQAPHAAQTSQQSSLGLPPMLGMPGRPSGVGPLSGYTPTNIGGQSEPSDSIDEGAPKVTLGSIVFLLVSLAVVVSLIIMLL